LAQTEASLCHLRLAALDEKPSTWQPVECSWFKFIVTLSKETQIASLATMRAFSFLLAVSLCGGAFAIQWEKGMKSTLRLRDYTKKKTGYMSRERRRAPGNVDKPEDHTARWRQRAIEAQFGQKKAASLLQEKFVAHEDLQSNFLDRAGGGYFSEHAKGETMARYKINAAKEKTQLLDIYNGLAMTNTQKKAKLQKEGIKSRLKRLRKKEERETYQETLKEEEELQKQKSKEHTSKEEQDLQKKQEQEALDKEQERALWRKKQDASSGNLYNKRTIHRDPLKAYRKHIATMRVAKSRPQYPTAKKQLSFLARLAQRLRY